MNEKREKMVKTTVELPEPLWKKAKTRAIEEGDLRTVIINALEVYLKRGAK